MCRAGKRRWWHGGDDEERRRPCRADCWMLTRLLMHRIVCRVRPSWHPIILKGIWRRCFGWEESSHIRTNRNLGEVCGRSLWWTFWSNILFDSKVWRVRPHQTFLLSLFVYVLTWLFSCYFSVICKQCRYRGANHRQENHKFTLLSQRSSQVDMGEKFGNLDEACSTF